MKWNKSNQIIDQTKLKGHLECLYIEWIQRPANGPTSKKKNIKS